MWPSIDVQEGNSCPQGNQWQMMILFIKQNFSIFLGESQIFDMGK